MTVEWTNESGKTLTLHVQGEDENCNGESCYVVSKVEGSPYVFLVPKDRARATFC